MTEYWFREFDKDQRDKMSKSGQAMPDGSFPIATVQDLKNAIAAYGRARNKAAAKKHIIKRAKALGKTDLLPADWEGSTKEANDLNRLIAVKMHECWDDSELEFADLTPAFLNKLRDLVKAKVKDGDLSADDWNDAVKRARAHAGGKGKAAKAKMPEDEMPEDKKAAGEESLSDVIRKVDSALYTKYKTTNNNAKYWSREIFAASVIVCDQDTGKYYRVPYSIGLTGDVEFGEFQEVEEEYVPIQSSALFSETGEPFQLFYEIPLEFGEPPDWMPVLPKPGKYKHKKYGKIELTDDRLKNFIKNFDAQVYDQQLPISPGHDEDKMEREGAMGWIKSLRQNSDGSVDGQVEWSDLGDAAIRNNRYKYISPEWQDKYEDRFGEKHTDVLVGAAITTRPYFKANSMRPLIASERGWMIGERKSLQPNGNCTIFCVELQPEVRMADAKKCTMPGCKEDAMSGSKYCEMHAKEKEMADDSQGVKTAKDITDLQEQVKTLSETVTKQTSDLKTASETITKQAEQLKAASETMEVMRKNARRKTFADLAKGFTGKTDDHIATMEFFADHDEKGEESEQLKKYVEAQTAIAAQLQQSGIFTEVGSEAGGIGGSAQDKLEALTQKRMTENPKLTHAQAYREVSDTPEGMKLYNQHRQEVN